MPPCTRSNGPGVNITRDRSSRGMARSPRLQRWPHCRRTLDRNGLRPARYTLTSHGLLILASEAGVVPCDAARCCRERTVGPGRNYRRDLKYGVLLRDFEMKAALAQRQPYQQWLDHISAAPVAHCNILHHFCPSATPEYDAYACFHRQQLFGYTHEDVEFVLRPMLTENKEPIWSMGDDTPFAALSCQSRSLADYFHQRFAQVTNPPIDPLREQHGDVAGLLPGPSPKPPDRNSTARAAAPPGNTLSQNRNWRRYAT